MKNLINILKNYYLQNSHSESEANIKAHIYALACLDPDKFNDKQRNNIESLGIKLPTKKINQKIDLTSDMSVLAPQETRKEKTNKEIDIQTIGNTIIDELDLDKRLGPTLRNGRLFSAVNPDVEYIRYLEDVQQLLDSIKGAFEDQNTANSVFHQIGIQNHPVVIAQSAKEASQKLWVFTKRFSEAKDVIQNSKSGKALTAGTCLVTGGFGAAIGFAGGGPIGAAVGAVLGAAVGYVVSKIVNAIQRLDAKRYLDGVVGKGQRFFSPSVSTGPVDDVLEGLKQSVEHTFRK